MRRALTALLPCALLLAAGCGSSSRARDDIVFVSTRDGAYELYVMNADGSHERRLTSDRAETKTPPRLYYQLDPAWSPAGGVIAFTSERTGTSHLFVVGANGSRTRPLTSASQPDSHATWSPDGKQLAFVRGTTGAIVVTNANGSAGRAVTTGPGSAGDPAWSPDGRWIAYDVKAPGATTSELWLVHPDGTGRRRLTSLGADSVSPAWSPNGRTIAFSSDYGGATLGIYAIGADGSSLQLITRGKADAIDPAWSPDGKLIAFSEDGAIVTIHPDASGERTLTNPKNNDSSPVWNPHFRSGKAG